MIKGEPSESPFDSECMELLDNVKSGIAIYKAVNNGEDFIFVKINKSVELFEGVTKESVVGKSVLKVFPGIVEFGLFDVFRRVYQTGTAENHPTTLYQDDRIKCWRDNFVFKMSTGEIVAVYQNVNKQVQLEEEIEHQNVRFKSIFNSFIDAVVFRDSNNSITHINPAFISMTGYSDIDSLNNNSYFYYSDETLQNLAQEGIIFSDEIPNDNLFFEAKLKCSEHRTLWVESSISPIVNSQNEQVGTIEIFKDITERKALQIATEAESERLKRIVKIAELDFDTITGLLDYALKELLILTSSKYGYIYHYNETNKEFSLNSWSDEAFIDCSITDKETKYSLESTGLWGEVVRQRKAIVDNDFKVPSKHKKGFPQGHVKLDKYMTIPIFSNKEIVAVAGVANKIEDYTENDLLQMTIFMNSVWRLVENKERLNNAIAENNEKLHRQKLETLGVLAGGIAHDFNNLLTAIMGNVELALDEIDDNPNIEDYLQSINTASIEAASLCKKMLDYSGKGKFILQNAKLGDLAISLKSVLKHTISKKIDIDLTIKVNEQPIYCDKQQINQVIMNLIVNASEAIGDNVGSIKITTGTIKLSEGSISNSFTNVELTPGLFSFIKVEDDGCGMSEEVKRKMFEPFFTTKFTGRGLGMSAVLGIIKGHNGHLCVDSEENIGTTFTIYIPVSKNIENVENLTNNIQKDKIPPNKCILLVDDEETVRNVSKMMLKKMNINCITAINGLDALEKYNENIENIDLIILDLTMPNMSGDQVYLKIRETNGSIPVLIASGYSKEDVEDKFSSSPENLYFIQKPFRKNKLEKLLIEAFN